MMKTEVQLISKQGYTSIVSGFIIALVAFQIPLMEHIFSYFGILVHEIGHAFCGILFAYPSIPAFDFVYGGGVTTIQSRSQFFLALIYLAFAGVFYYLLPHRKQAILFVIVITVYSFIAFTNVHQLLILFMGHGMELVIAGIFLYRGISGASVIHKVEQPLYAALGFFIVFFDMRFAHRLMTSSYHRTLYENAKGGGHWMDFSRLALDMGMNLPNIAFLFLLCCLLPVILSFLYYRYRTYILKAIFS